MKPVHELTNAEIVAEVRRHARAVPNPNQERRMSTKMRAKMLVQSVKSYGDPVTQETLSLMAVTSTPFGPNGENEDNTYARYTPMANLSITINNPALLGQFKEGQKYYLDFTPADGEAAKPTPGVHEITQDEFAQAGG